jgi:hypothetical protein
MALDPLGRTVGITLAFLPSGKPVTVQNDALHRFPNGGHGIAFDIQDGPRDPVVPSLEGAPLARRTGANHHAGPDREHVRHGLTALDGHKPPFRIGGGIVIKSEPMHQARTSG